MFGNAKELLIKIINKELGGMNIRHVDFLHMIVVKKANVDQVTGD